MLEPAIVSVASQEVSVRRRHRWLTAPSVFAILIALMFPLPSIAFTGRGADGAPIDLRDLLVLLWPLYVGAAVFLVASLAPRWALALLQVPVATLVTVLGLAIGYVGYQRLGFDLGLAYMLIGTAVPILAAVWVPGRAEIRVARMGIAYGAIMFLPFTAFAIAHRSVGDAITAAGALGLVVGSVQWWREARRGEEATGRR